MSQERYEIKGKIGQGGVGAVYRAYDTQLRREVAIKRVLATDGDNNEQNELATTNLLKEATALSSVQHPHICTVYDAGIDGDGPFVVMELINGKTLDEMVERGTLTFDDFREVAIQSQEAMIAAQDLDLVHRDLKPSNVMVCWLPSGRFQVKLVDFGLAKFSAKPSLQTIDHGDAVFGSIFFMAPEQFERTPLDRRTDMYALGCMFYYSLSGTYPFNGDSAPQVMASHLQNSVQPLKELRPDLPAWLCDWVMWHIARNMDDRPESARVALEKFLSDETNSAQNGGVPTPRTGPQLVIPATSTQTSQPAQPTPTVAKTHTSPQSISPAHGNKIITAPQTITPSSSITGSTSIQPAKTSTVDFSPQIPTATKKLATEPQTTTPAYATQALGNHTPSPGSNNPYSTPSSSLPTQDSSTPTNVLPTKPQKSKTPIAILLSVGIIIALVILFITMGEKKEEDTLHTLVSQINNLNVKEFPTTQAETKELLDSLQNKSLPNRSAVFHRLNKAKATGNFSVDQMIVEYATGGNINSEDRRNLIRIIKSRKNPQAMRSVIIWSTKNPNSDATLEAISGSNVIIADDQFSNLISIMRDTENRATQNAAEKALNSLIKKSNFKDSFANQLIDNFDSSISKNFQLASLRLLGSTGADAAKRVISKNLNNANPDLRTAAAKAYSLWPNDEPLEDLLNAFDNEESTPVKNSLFKSAIKLLTTKRERESSKLQEDWITLASTADSDSNKIAVIKKAVQANAPWSTRVVELFQSDEHSDYIRKRANAAIERLK